MYEKPLLSQDQMSNSMFDSSAAHSRKGTINRVYLDFDLSFTPVHKDKTCPSPFTQLMPERNAQNRYKTITLKDLVGTGAVEIGNEGEVQMTKNLMMSHNKLFFNTEVSLFDEQVFSRQQMHDKLLFSKESGVRGSLLNISNPEPSEFEYSLLYEDVNRCEPNEIFDDTFLQLHGLSGKQKYSKTKEMIETILKDLCCHFKVKKYTQGMSFWVCFLTIVLKGNRKNISYLVTSLLEKPYYLAKLYADGFQMLNMNIFLLKNLLKRKIPELYKKFKEENVNLQDFVLKWIMTIFCCQRQLNMPAETLLKIWDLFLVHGWKIILSILLAIFSLNKESLLQMNYEEMIQFFQNGVPEYTLQWSLLSEEKNEFLIDERELFDLVEAFRSDAAKQLNVTLI